MDFSLVNYMFKLLKTINTYDFYLNVKYNLIFDKVVVVLVIELCGNAIMKQHRV